jgi:hypothetical protein
MAGRLLPIVRRSITARRDGDPTDRHIPGAIVTNLPDGCTTVNANGVTCLQYNGDYYQPIEYNGQPAYEVVDVEGAN